MNKTALTGKDMELLRLLKLSSFANPFSDERRSLDLKISGLSSSVSSSKLIESTLRAAKDVLKRVDESGTAGRFSDEEKDLLRTAKLFDIYHDLIPSFDKLIIDQMSKGNEPHLVSFAGNAIKQIESTGCSKHEACRYFAMFYQLRRAYYFINNAITGKSESIKRLRLALWNNIFTTNMDLYNRYLWNRMEDFSTLLLGETGTGKGAAANAIGRSGFIPFDDRNGVFTESFARSFVAINISQYPESLIESELFGHRKGAFTGAVEAHEGIFSKCSPHGAIFIDEIGEVSVPVQIKLLQVLQERVFTPVGSHDKIRFSGRVIGATNKPADKLIGKSGFREDFFYRLCSDVIIVPPLRQRLAEEPEELPSLISYSIKRITGTNELTSNANLTDYVVERVRKSLKPDYPWPGNVRELEQCVRRILLTGSYQGQEISSIDTATRIHTRIDNGAYTADGLLSDYSKILHQRHGSYEAVAQILETDRRTAKKYIQAKE